MINVISATRLSESDFWRTAPLGLSLRRLALDKRLAAEVTFENRRGLPEIYNAHISASGSADILVFVHDDVWFDDHFLPDRLIDGLQRFDVIGVAGNRRRVRLQPAWPFVDARFTWDDKSSLSGAVAHGNHPFGPVTLYGPVPAECELLDGVFLAAKRAALVASEVSFDPRFDFEFYDMDFCRTARQRGLRLGTWPISLTHQSRGAYGSQRWWEMYLSYLRKWEAEQGSDALAG